MGFALKCGYGYGYSFLCVIALLPALSYSKYFTSSRATYYGSPDGLGTPTGACGFGEYGRTVNDGNVASVSRLYKNGSGCGGCYEVRCKAPGLCTDDGVDVVVTDYGEGDKTDFILSTSAYENMAYPSTASELFKYGVVEIEFRRISCSYPGYTLMFKVHEQSKFPQYLALVPIYQSGQSEIVAVEFFQKDRKRWRSMRKAYGAVWDTLNPPKDDITLRFQVRGSAGITWLIATDVIPSDWQVGVAYDSSILLY